LVLHELASNARKFGALSVAGGRVDVRWSRDGDGLVDLSWAETGGPPVVAPGRKGFGTTVIETAMPSAETELFYKPEGLRCRIQFQAQSARATTTRAARS
jgi:two-component sensor histidine kinase